MRPQKMFSLLIPLLLLCSVAFCETTPYPSFGRRGVADAQVLTKDEAYRAVIGEQLMLLDEYREVNYDLTLKLQECNGYVSVALPNATTPNPSFGRRGVADAQSWRSTSDFYLTQNNQKAQDIAEVNDSLQAVIDKLLKTVPEKGSGSDAWFGWIAAGAMLIYNFVTWIIGKKKKK